MTEIESEAALLTSLRQAGLVRTRNPALCELRGGVSSDIVLVSDGGRRFVVKRALGKLRVNDDWFADVGRNQVEQRYLAYAAALAPDAVPRILGSSADDGWFAMEYFGKEFAPWKQPLLAGEADPMVARRAGRVLGRIHRLSWGDPLARGQFATLGNFEQLRIEPYLRTTAARLPEARRFLTEEADRLSASQIALVHGDFSPKNLLAGPDRLVVLDAECGWFGDPAFDPAFLLNHLHLKALLHSRIPEAILGLVTAFWDAYTATLGVRADAEYEARIVRLLLGLMLARVHGKSPVEYLAEPSQRAFVTQFALGRLTAPPPDLKTVAEAWRTGLARL